MYSYNSYHKVITMGIVFLWAILHFTLRSDKGLYHDNGQAKRSGSVNNSLNEGLWTWYYDNGTIQMQGNFHKGNREGIWKTYDPSGNLIIESTYKKNMLNGLFTQYDEKGNVLNQYVYENDKIVNKKSLSD